MDPFYIALLLLLGGLFAVSLELLLPSAGTLGILGVCLLAAAIFYGFQQSLASGAIILLIILVALPVVFKVMLTIWPYTPLGKRILIGEIKPEDVLPNSEHYQRYHGGLEDQIGVAKTKMLPSGMVLIGGEKYEAVSQGFAIEPGDAVQVVSVRQHRLYVVPYHGDGPSVSGATMDRPVEDPFESP